MNGFIYVKPLPGRVAFSAPIGGFQLPPDVFTMVREDRWIRDLIYRHGDIEARYQPDIDPGHEPSLLPVAVRLAEAPEAKADGEPDLASDKTDTPIARKPASKKGA